VPANRDLKLSDPENLTCMSPSDLDIVPYLLVWTKQHVSFIGAHCLDFSRPEGGSSRFFRNIV